jgi:hypothetical protein
MTKRTPRFATLVKTNPDDMRKLLRAWRHHTWERATELSVPLETLDRTLAHVTTVGAYETIIERMRTSGTDTNVADVLAYPLPTLMNPELVLESGKPNWPQVNALMKHLEYWVRLPLHPAAPMDFPTARACIALVLSPAYGRRIDLERQTWFKDVGRREGSRRSFARAMLMQHRLAYLRALAEFPELA